MARAGRVEIEFAANLARLQQDVSRATGMLEGFARTAKTALAAVGAGVTVAGFAAFVKDTAEAYDRLGRLSQQTGLTAQQLSKLSYIAKMADLDLDTLAKNVKILDRNMFQAAQGGGKAFEAFRALGLSVRDASGKLAGNEEILTKLAERFAKMPDGAMKTALAMQIFGKSGADMIPMLNLGAEGLRYFAEEAERLKGALSEEMVRKAEAIQLAFKKLDVVRETAGRQMFAGMADDIIRVATAWEMLITKTRTWEMIGKAAGFAIKGIAGAFVALAFGAEYSLQIVMNLIDAFKTKWDQVADVVNRSDLKEALENLFGRKFNLPQFNEARVGADVLDNRLRVIADKYREIGRAIDLFGEREVKMPPIPRVPQGPEPPVPVSDQVVKEWERAREKLAKIQSDMQADLSRSQPGLDEWDRKIIEINRRYNDFEAEAARMREHFRDYPQFVRQIDELAGSIDGYRFRVIALLREEQALADSLRATQEAMKAEQEEFARRQHVLGLNRWRLTGLEQAQAEIANLQHLVDGLEALAASQDLTTDKGRAMAEQLRLQIDENSRLIEAVRMRWAVESEGLNGVLAGLTAYVTESQRVGKMMEDATTGAIRRMEDVLVDFTETGKLSFQDMARSILSDLQRIIIRAMILGPLIKELKDSMGGMGIGGGLFGGGGMDLFSLFGGASGMFFHGGGIVGRDGTPRYMPASLFMGAPRLHGGLASDEVPAILQKGETVIPKGQAPGPVEIHIHAVDGPSFEDLVRRNPGVIVGQVEKALRGNQSLRYLIKDTAR